MIYRLFIPAFLIAMLGGCFSTPAIEVKDICSLLDEEVSWYKSIKASSKKYKVPMHVQLAIIYQESHFASDAKPPRGKLFGVLPWFRPSSAYGFAQVKDETWDWYKLKTGNNSADRDDFDDAADFVGWYINKSYERSGISKSDTFNQYLAYHEGHGGFNKKSYSSKGWLIKVAKNVQSNAKQYKNQLNQCKSRLDSNSVWSFLN